MSNTFMFCVFQSQSALYQSQNQSPYYTDKIVQCTACFASGTVFTVCECITIKLTCTTPVHESRKMQPLGSLEIFSSL